MGLDITAYSNLRAIDPEFERIRDRVPGVFGQLGEETCTFTQAQVDSPNNWISDMDPGTYYETPETEVLDFRAGSYSGYNDYRRMLSECFLNVPPDNVWANERAYIDKPFYEQINFSDCEGFIGPKVSAKLFEDYKKGRAKWEAFLKDSFGSDQEEKSWRLNLYDKWTRAFELAADDGIVWFC